GILHPGVRCAIGNGVVLDPDTLFHEIDGLVKDGVDVEGRLYVSDRAHLVLPYHKLVDAESSASKEIGTTGRGIGPAYEDKVARPLPTEMDEQLAGETRKLGNEFGATAGRPGRCGWFDAVVVRYAARVNGLTDLAVTKLDVLDTFEKLALCNGYEAEGEVHREFPADLSMLEHARPQYEWLPGWKQQTAAARRIEERPSAARR